MEMDFRGYVSEIQGGEEKPMGVKDVRKGSWTDEEDALLFNYVNLYGEGQWNSVAFNTGLKRTGKSCRLRWLNYLRPDLRRGNITLEEQLLILYLHCRWGNRWSKIAKHIPGRTDNEIKNYWRTRVQKQVKHIKCDVNSQQFHVMLREVFIPRLMEKIGTLKASVGGISSESWDTHVSQICGMTESSSSGVSGHDCIESSHNLFRESGTRPEFVAPGEYLDVMPSQLSYRVQFFDQSINNHRLDGRDDKLFDTDAWNQESLTLLRQQLFEEDL